MVRHNSEILTYPCHPHRTLEEAGFSNTRSFQKQVQLTHIHGHLNNYQTNVRSLRSGCAIFARSHDGSHGGWQISLLAQKFTNGQVGSPNGLLLQLGLGCRQASLQGFQRGLSELFRILNPYRIVHDTSRSLISAAEYMLVTTNIIGFAEMALH